MFSWDGVEQGEWEDTDFLKVSEEKSVRIDLKGSDWQRYKSDRIEIDSAEKHGRD